MNWYFEVIRKYGVFDGRARRKEYWMFGLINIVISFGLAFAGGLYNDQPAMGPVMILYLVYTLAILLPSLAVAVRRLHDTGRSGWWLLIVIVPLIGALALFIFAVQDSEPGTNQYGPNPKAMA